MTTDYLCNLIVPGAAKSGTSSLHEALNQHPQICMSANKEPHYFCRSEKYELGSSYHNSLFSQTASTKIYGESSTGYMIWPDAIDKIASDLENPKIILVLRDPVSRTISHWQWRTKLGLEGRPLLSAIENNGYGYDPERSDDGYGYMSYLQFSEYSKYCPMWIDKFGKENCLLIKTEDLNDNFREVMLRCFSFLNIDEYYFNNSVKSNKTSNATVRPKPFMTKIMSPIPKPLKNLKIYNKFRHTVLKSISPKKSLEINQRDISYLKEILRNETQYFNTLTS